MADGRWYIADIITHMKVMLSLPPESVLQLDELARERDSTRSELVRGLADAEATRQRLERSRRIKHLLEHPVSRGDGTTEFLRAERHRDG